MRTLTWVAVVAAALIGLDATASSAKAQYYGYYPGLYGPGYTSYYTTSPFGYYNYQSVNTPFGPVYNYQYQYNTNPLSPVPGPWLSPVPGYGPSYRYNYSYGPGGYQYSYRYRY
jgi:hypothetical protein